MPFENISSEMIFKSSISDELLDNHLLPHRIELGCFLIISAGEAKLNINLTTFNIRANNIVTLLPRSIIQLIDRSDNFQCDIIAFSPEFVKDIELIRNILIHLETIGRNPVLVLNEDEIPMMNEFCSVYLKMYKRTKQHHNKNTELMHSMLMSFLYGICAIYDKHKSEEKKVPTSRKEEIMRDFLFLLFRNYRNERSVSFYADKLCITPKYLNAVVKELRGEVATDVIASAVILDAKVQLKSSTKTIQQIADDLDFSDQSFFGKYFKKHVGLSPKQYRDN